MGKKAKRYHPSAYKVARTLIRTWPETFGDWQVENLASYFHGACRPVAVTPRKRQKGKK